MLDKKYDAKKIEKKWQDQWQESGVYKYDPDGKGDSYSIDTPPPTISGNIHIGHISSYTQTEVIARHQRMLGKRVFYPFGFDDNGLPTERYVEKKRKVKASMMDRTEFAKLCLEETHEMEPRFSGLFRSAGFSSDFDNCYSTVSPRSQFISQSSFLDLYKKGEVERRLSACLWCPECRTATAQSLVDSTELVSVMNFIIFGIEGSDEKVEVMTTRPELLSACVCVFVNPIDERHKHLVGKNLVTPVYNVSVPVLTNPDVLMDKGTGVVMCCTFGDEADAKWQKEYNLPVIEAILPNGRMSEIAGEGVAGLKVVEARQVIIEKLKTEGKVVKQEDIVHIVSTCERCGSTIEILTKPQWFIKILEHRDEIYQAGLDCNWYPKSMQKRFLSWVEGLKWDWSISRQRYFGVPFPVWYCADCGEIVLATRDMLPVDPTITEYKGVCPKCGGTHFVGEKDIMDTWATSSLTPQICTDIVTGKGLDDTMIPMSLRPNAHDNIRVWDFYTIAKSLLHFGKLPWTDVMINGHILAGKSEKLSKSKNNSGSSPEGLIDRYSADVVRYWACNMSLGKDTVLSDEEFLNGTKVVQKLWNASKFVLMFMEEKGIPQKPEIILGMDEWILGCYIRAKSAFDSYMEKYEMGLALKEVEKLFWNFCDNYIEIAKNRLYKPEIYGNQAKESALYAISTVLSGILKLFAIYFPHITEEIYMDAFAPQTGEKSIHVSGYLVLDTRVRPEIIKGGDEVCEIVSQIRGLKSQNSVSLRTPVDTLTLCGYSDFCRQVEDDIMAVGNVSEIIYKNGRTKSIDIKLGKDNF